MSKPLPCNTFSYLVDYFFKCVLLIIALITTRKFHDIILVIICKLSIGVKDILSRSS